MTEQVLAVDKLSGRKIYVPASFVELFDNLAMAPSARKKRVTKKATPSSDDTSSTKNPTP